MFNGEWWFWKHSLLHLAWFHWTRDFIQTKMPFGYNPCVYGMQIPYYSELSASFNIALTTWPDIIALFVRMRNWHLFGSNGMNIYESKWMASLMAHNWTINLSRKGAHTHTHRTKPIYLHTRKHSTNNCYLFTSFHFWLVWLR